MNSEQINIKVDCTEGVNIQPNLRVTKEGGSVKVSIDFELSLRKTCTDTFLNPKDMLTAFKQSNMVTDMNLLLKPCW